MPDNMIMGHFVYGPNTLYEFDDRTLSHLKLAIGAKLRRQESFYLSWIVPSSLGSGRITVWLGPAIPIQFEFRTEFAPEANREWVKALTLSASGDCGMIVVDELEAAQHLPDNPRTSSAS